MVQLERDGLHFVAPVASDGELLCYGGWELG